MKHILKKTALLTLALLTVLTLLLATACGDSKDDTPAPTQPTEQRKDGSIGRSEFIDEIGGVSETYTGSVSEESYVSANDAAEAFVIYELAGNDTATVINTEQKELNTSEIAASGIPTDILEGSDSVEEVELTYSLSESAVSTFSTYSAAALAPQMTVKVYVIKYGVDWKYFAPMPVTGTTVTKSYYDSVFNSDKYENCTFQSISYIYEEVAGEPLYGGTVEKLIKYADGRIYFEQTISGYFGSSLTPGTLYAYLETVDGTTVCYVKNGENGEWALGSLTTVGFSNIDALRPFYDSYLDYTYFTKTDFGFVLADENAEKYVTTLYNAMLGAMSSYINWDGSDIDMYSEYYVSDGALTGVRTDLEFDIMITAEGETAILELTSAVETKCTDYGTTVVEKPFE